MDREISLVFDLDFPLEIDRVMGPLPLRIDREQSHNSIHPECLSYIYNGVNFDQLRLSNPPVITLNLRPYFDLESIPFTFHILDSREHAAKIVLGSDSCIDLWTGPARHSLLAMDPDGHLFPFEPDTASLEQTQDDQTSDSSGPTIGSGMLGLSP